MWSARLAAAVIALFCIILILSPFFPVFLDDIYYSFLGTRAGYDGWKIISAFPQCTRAFGMSIPFTMLPGKAVSWELDAAMSNFFVMRFIADGLLVIWIAYAAWTFLQCFQPAQPVYFIVACVISFVTLGNLTFPMLMNRPESAMILGITFYASLPLLVHRYPSPPWWCVMLVMVFFLLVTSCFVSSHAKIIYYAPLAVFSAGALGKWNKPMGLALAGLTAFIFFQAWVEFWQFRITCPEADSDWPAWHPVIAPSLLLKHNLIFWNKVALNIMQIPIYVKWLLFHGVAYWIPANRLWPYEEISNYVTFIVGLFFLPNLITHGFRHSARYLFQSDRWKHPVFISTIGVLLCLVFLSLEYSDAVFYKVSIPEKIMWVSYGFIIITFTGITNFLVVIVFACTLLWSVRGSVFAFHSIRERRDWSNPLLLCAFSLLAAFGAQCVMQIDKSFYNAQLLWLTLVLNVAMGTYYLKEQTPIWHAYWKGREENLLANFCVLCLAAALSQAMFLILHVSAMADALGRTTPNGMMMGTDGKNQWALISPLHYEERRERVLLAAESCHIPTDSTGRHIEVDNYTYRPLKATYQPFLYMRFQLFDPISKFFVFMRQSQSSGIVMDCNSFPAEIRPYAKMSNGFCCMTKEQLDKLGESAAAH